KGLQEEKAHAIVTARNATPFASIDDLALRSKLTTADLQILASADALHKLSGNRHQARWQAAAVEEARPLFSREYFNLESDTSTLTTSAPSTEKNISTDYQTTGHSLRVHPMALLRSEYPFNR